MYHVIYFDTNVYTLQRSCKNYMKSFCLCLMASPFWITVLIEHTLNKMGGNPFDYLPVINNVRYRNRPVDKLVAFLPVFIRYCILM